MLFLQLGTMMADLIDIQIERENLQKLPKVNVPQILYAR